MCRGVSPSSNPNDAGAGVFVFLLVVAGRDFLVILWKYDRQIQFNIFNLSTTSTYGA